MEAREPGTHDSRWTTKWIMMGGNREVWIKARIGLRQQLEQCDGQANSPKRLQEHGLINRRFHIGEP